jgi:hypothetical protein
VGFGLVLVSCGGGDGKAPQSPAAPSAFAGAGNETAGIAMASSQGLAPEGFELRMKLDPRPGEDGIIRDGSPVTVDIDLCGSTPDAGKTLHFLFDFDFNDLAEVVGTGDTCHQKHTYRVPKDATKDIVLESNVCVTNGDPGVHDGSTYFSCRVVRVALPKPTANLSCETGAPAGCYPFFLGGSLSWPGGTVADSGVFAFDNETCQGQGDPAPFRIVLACTEQQAVERCGTDLVTGFPFQGDLFLVLCGPVGPPVLAKDSAWMRGLQEGVSGKLPK